jgi:hypothetical protein
MNFVDMDDARAFVAGLDLGSVGRLLQACVERAEPRMAAARVDEGLRHRHDVRALVRTVVEASDAAKLERVMAAVAEARSRSTDAANLFCDAIAVEDFDALLAGLD